LLRNNSHTLDDLSSVASGTAAIPGDISPERLIPQLQEAVDNAFSHWDMQFARPEGGRGVSNPWKHKVGTVLAAYYAHERTRLRLNDALAHESAVDTVNAQISEAEAAVAHDETFVREGRARRNGISQRSALEQRHASLQREISDLTGIARDWPATEARVAQLAKEVSRLEIEQSTISEELRIAVQRKSAEQFTRDFQRMREAREELARGRAELSAMVAPDGVQLNELRETERSIADLSIQIAAQSLVASVEVSQPTSVEVERGALPKERVRIEPGVPWTADAEGRIVLRADTLTLTVRIANGEIEQQLRELNDAQSRNRELLLALQVESLPHAEQMSNMYREKQESVNVLVRLFNAALGDRTPEGWDAEMESLRNLPGTRDLEVLEKERQAQTERMAQLRVEAEQGTTTINGWAERFEGPEAAFNLLITQKSDLFTVGAQLEALPQLPAGYASSTEYLDALATAETGYEEAGRHLAALRERRATLSGNVIAETAEDLQVELEHAERDFQRALALANAYQRILEKAEALVAEATDNPLAAYQERLTSAFAFMTRNRYNAVRLNGSVPDRVSGEAIAIESERLSQGAIGTLALATRMAMAEIYLGDMKGFAIMDDPLTDMDADRRAAAVEFMCEFGRTRQLIVLTCHANHAAEFEAAGATLVSVG